MDFNHLAFPKLRDGQYYSSTAEWINMHYDHHQLQTPSPMELPMPEKISSPELKPFPPSLVIDNASTSTSTLEQHYHHHHEETTFLPPFPDQITTCSNNYNVDINGGVVAGGANHDSFVYGGGGGDLADVGEDILPLLCVEDTCNTTWPPMITTTTINPPNLQLIPNSSADPIVDAKHQLQQHMNYVHPTSALPLFHDQFQVPSPIAVAVPLDHSSVIQNSATTTLFHDQVSDDQITLTATNNNTNSCSPSVHDFEVKQSTTTTTTTSTTLVEYSNNTIKKEVMMKPSTVVVPKKFCRSKQKGGSSNKNNSYNLQRSNEALEFEEIKEYFEVPISIAAKELKVGLTVLKKRCRELGIKRWPHRKIKSLRALIKNVQELGLFDEVAVIEEQIRMLKRSPQFELTESTKKLRQSCFKANYKKRRMASSPFLSTTCTRTTPRRSSSIFRF